MTKMMRNAERIVNEAIINYGFESDYTIQIAISYEAFLNNPNEDTYFALIAKQSEAREAVENDED